MNLFDIIGPVMVGPSSSHTAGAAKIGNVCNKLMAEKIESAEIYLHGSFAETGKGHGTDKAIVGGLLGMACDDERLPESFDVAQEIGFKFTIFWLPLSSFYFNIIIKTSCKCFKYFISFSSTFKIISFI